MHIKPSCGCFSSFSVGLSQHHASVALNMMCPERRQCLVVTPVATMACNLSHSATISVDFNGFQVGNQLIINKFKKKEKKKYKY